eukprot:PhM_4_TR8153/c0_g1_i1/m.26900
MVASSCWRSDAASDSHASNWRRCSSSFSDMRSSTAATARSFSARRAVISSFARRSAVSVAPLSLRMLASTASIVAAASTLTSAMCCSNVCCSCTSNMATPSRRMRSVDAADACTWRTAVESASRSGAHSLCHSDCIRAQDASASSRRLCSWLSSERAFDNRFSMSAFRAMKSACSECFVSRASRALLSRMWFLRSSISVSSLRRSKASARSHSCCFLRQLSRAWSISAWSSPFFASTSARSWSSFVRYSMRSSTSIWAALASSTHAWSSSDCFASLRAVLHFSQYSVTYSCMMRRSYSR